MTRDLSRRDLLASGTALLAGGALASVAGATDADGPVADPPPVRWAETYDRDATDTVQDALRTSDGDCVVAGQSGEGPGSPRPWVFAVDERGDSRWQRRLDTDESAGFNTVVEASDGGFLLGGYRGRAAEGQEALLVGLNADREVRWRRTVESPRQGGNIVSLVPVGEGEFVAAGLARGGDLLDVSAWVFGIDGEGERQWSQTFTPRYTNYAASVAQTGNGGYLLGGAVRAEPADADRQPPFIGWLFEVDSEGGQQWSETYSETADGSDHQLNFFYDVYATGSGYLAAGNTSPELLSGHRGWVLSVDDSGQRREQLLTRPDSSDIAQFRQVRSFEDGYALVGSAQASANDPANVWGVGIGDDLSEQWSATEQFANGSQATTALGTDDGGLLVFGNANVEGDQTTTDALAVKLGGDPVPTGTPTAAPEPAATASPTPSLTPTPSPTLTPTATPAGTTAEAVAPQTTGDAGTTSDDGPGFGFGTALAALASGALLRRYGRSDGNAGAD